MYPLSPIIIPEQPVSTPSAQETPCKFPGFRENFTNFQDAFETRRNFNPNVDPNVVETGEWAQLAKFCQLAPTTVQFFQYPMKKFLSLRRAFQSPLHLG